MTNRFRGEIEAVLDGAKWTLCLTLGALAELESALGADHLAELAERFASGHLAAGDAIKIIGAGLGGAGHDVADEAVARMKADGGAGGFVRTVADLLSATFGATAAADAVAKPATQAAARPTTAAPAKPAADAAPTPPPVPPAAG